MNTMMNLNENVLAAVVGGTDAECDFEIGAKPVEIEGLGIYTGYEVGINLGVTGLDWNEATNYYGPVTPTIAVSDDQRAWTPSAPIQLGIGVC